MNQCIQQVLTAVGDNAGHPLCIETVHRHGYRFIAPVESKIVPVTGPRLVETAEKLCGFPLRIVTNPGNSACLAPKPDSEKVSCWTQKARSVALFSGELTGSPV
jgi:hypothetical protein